MQTFVGFFLRNERELRCWKRCIINWNKEISNITGLFCILNCWKPIRHRPVVCWILWKKLSSDEIEASPSKLSSRRRRLRPIRRPLQEIRVTTIQRRVPAKAPTATIASGKVSRPLITTTIKNQYIIIVICWLVTGTKFGLGFVSGSKKA